MRLIDAEELKSKATMISDYGQLPEDEGYIALSDLLKAPTIDAAPVVHAQWIDESGTIVCSHCHHKRNTADREYTKYCGHCGAKMGEDK